MSTAFVGMFGIIFLMGWMNGLFEAMFSGAIDTGLGHIQVRPVGYEKSRKITMHFEDPVTLAGDITKIGNISGFDYAPRFEREGMLRLGSFNRGVLLYGIEARSEANVSSFDDWIVQGTYLNEKSSQDNGEIECLIGQSNAEKMEVEIGDGVILSTGGEDGETKSVRARVMGIFNSPVAPVNKYTVILRREDLSRLFNGKTDNISAFVYRGKENELIEEVADKLRNALNERGHNNTVEVLTYFQLQSQIKRMFEISDQFMDILYVIFLTGFALTLLNSILMSVFERMREIGIQRAIGASMWEIIVEILIESFYLSVIGSGAGFIAGSGVVLLTGWTGISFGFYAESLDILGNMSSIIYPFLNLDNIITAFSLAVVVSILAGFYPAWKASRTDPVKAIQNK